MPKTTRVDKITSLFAHLKCHLSFIYFCICLEGLLKNKEGFLVFLELNKSVY